MCKCRDGKLGSLPATRTRGGEYDDSVSEILRVGWWLEDDPLLSRFATFLLLAALLGACATQSPLPAEEQCEAIVDDTARLLEAPPDDLASLVAELGQQDEFDGKLTPGRSRSFAWFREVGGSVTLCSYHPSRNECDRDIVAINFREDESGWYPVRPWASGPACIRLNRHGGRIILPASSGPDELGEISRR